MKKTFAALSLILTFFIAATGIFFINLAQANPYMYHEFVSPPAGSTPLIVSVASPKNNAEYNVNNIAIDFNISTKGTSLNSLLDAYFKADWISENVTVYKQNTYSPEFPKFWDYNKTFQSIPDGEHSIVITSLGGGGYAEGLTYNFFDMTTTLVVNFTIDATPPKVNVLSPENKTYVSPDIPLNFNVSETSTVKYSLDGQDNSPLDGNMTLTNLPIGEHNLKVYAWDPAGNNGVSGTVFFSETKPENSSTVPVAAVVVGALALVITGLLVFFRGGRREAL